MPTTPTPPTPPAAPPLRPHIEERPMPNDAGVEVAQRRINPAMEAAQRAAQIDHQRRVSGGNWADMPNGQAFRLPQYIPPSYEEDSKTARMLAAPELMLLQPKPPWRTGPRYQWRVLKATGPEQQRVANETARDLRSQAVRPVLKSETNPQSPFALFDSFELEDRVTFDSLILVEVMHEALTYARYKVPEDRAIRNVAQLPQTVASHPDTHAGKYATTVKQADIRQGG